MARITKRQGRLDSPTREALIDAAEKLLYEEGYANISARRISEEAGFKKQLLYYYFDSMDEIITETHSRFINDFISGLDEVFERDDPLQALWDLQLSGNARLFTEFLAIANHNDILRSMLTASSEKTKRIQTDKIADIFDRLGVDATKFPPKVFNFVISSITRNFIIEKELGIPDCEEELEAAVRMLFEWFETQHGGAIGSGPAQD